jgi:hypothetical protein
MIATDTDYATLRIRMPQGASLRSNSKSHGETSKALRNMRRVRQARDLPAHLTAQPRRPRFRSGHQRRRLARPSVISQVAQERQILDLTLVRLWRRSGIASSAQRYPSGIFQIAESCFHHRRSSILKQLCFAEPFGSVRALHARSCSPKSTAQLFTVLMLCASK